MPVGVTPGRGPGPERRLRRGHLRVIGTAARQPLPLAVLVVTVAMAFVVHPLILPLGIIAYVATVLTRTRDISLPPPRRRLAGISSPEFRRRLEDIDRVRREISTSVSMSYGSVREILQPITEQADELYYQANGLAAKGQAIEQYLNATESRERLEAEVSDLDRRIADSVDPYTSDQLRETRAALEDRRNNVQTLATYHGRVTAQLENIAANLKNVLAETVRLRASEIATAAPASDEAARRLRDLNAHMDAFQQVLEGALSETGSP